MVDVQRIVEPSARCKGGLRVRVRRAVRWIGLTHAKTDEQEGGKDKERPHVPTHTLTFSVITETGLASARERPRRLEAWSAMARRGEPPVEAPSMPVIWGVVESRRERERKSAGRAPQRETDEGRRDRERERRRAPSSGRRRSSCRP